MQHALAVLSLSFISPFLPAGESSRPTAAAQSALPDEAARLLPEKATLLLRLESAQRWVDLLQRFAAIEGPDAPRMKAEEIFAELQVPGDAAALDPSRPIAIAYELGQAGPVATFVVPVKDGAAYALSLEAQGNQRHTLVQLESYAGVSQSEGYAARDLASPLAARLSAGMGSVHVDLAGLIATYRPMFEPMLDQLEMQMDMAAEQGAGSISGVDLGVITGMYMDGARAFIDSAESLSVSASLRGDALEVQAELTALPGSPLAALGDAQSLDFATLARAIDGQASFTFLFGCDWTRFASTFQPLIDATTAMYPEPLRSGFEKYVRELELLYPLLGRVVAGSGDFGEGGMKVTYTLQSAEPQELVAGLQRAIASLQGSELGFAAGEPTRVEIGGLGVVQYSVAIDYDTFTRLASQSDETTSAEEAAEIGRFLQELYGAGPFQLSIAERGGLVSLVFASDPAYTATALARLNALATPVPLDLQHAIAQLNGSNPAFAFRYDFGRLMSQMKGFMSAMAGSGASALPDFPDQPVPLTFWGGIRGRTWTMGATTDVAKIVSFGSAISEAERAKRAGEERGR